MIARAGALAAPLLLATACAHGASSAPRSPPGSPSSPTPAGEIEAQARAFIEELARHDVAAAARRFDERRRAKTSEDDLAGVWAKWEQRFGFFEAVEAAKVQIEDSRWVYLTIRFARTRMQIAVLCEADDRIDGFWILPLP
jgi:hypothetical protein